MKALLTPGAIKKFRRTSWRFQTTFHTPLKDLENFVAAILSADDSVEQGVAVIDQIVFEPENLKAIFTSQTQAPSHNCSIEAGSRPDVHRLLCAMFSGWVDFAFIPSPKPFVIYADHDEFTTFYANTKSNLNQVVSVLSEKGFQQVPNWQRQLS